MKQFGLILVWMFLAVQTAVFAEEAAAPAPAAEAPAEEKKDEAASAETPSKAIKLRIVAVNPSKDKTQKVPIKIYLPKEVIPDDIIDMGQLKVGYDSEKGMYFAYDDAAELKPLETKIFEVKLEDVWKVKEAEIDKVKNHMKLALSRLEKTEHFAQAKVIVDSIDRRMNEIIAKQEDTSISREEHIGAYRVNLMTMNQIRQDINVLEKMLQHTGAPPSIELLKDTVFEKKTDLDRITAWKLIFSIIAFLALLGAGFYIRWFLLARAASRSQAKTMKKVPAISEKVEEHAGVKVAAGAESADAEKRKAG
jgi:hypothetical protein